jgi:serine/threonine protein kinase
MQVIRKVHSEPIPGYRLIEPLGRGGFGEVWKCEVPGGFVKAIKFVRGTDDNINSTSSGADQELHALQYIKSIRHPFLLSIERVEVVGKDLVIVMELADRSLHDLLEEYRKKGEPGLPRRELIGYLREAAEVLDLMNQEYGLKHLDVKPRNLFLVGRHIKVADFGLVSSLADLVTDGGEALMNAITPLYAAPETFSGKVTLYSDQYSLAVTYHELLTGQLPITAKSVRQLTLLVATAEPDLSGLAESDRPILARALAKEPRQRYPSCMAFVEALEAASPPKSESVPPSQARSTSVEIALGDTTNTTILSSSETKQPSGVYRRNSRMVQAVRPTGPNDGPLPGYHLLECLGRGPAGEAWQARGPRAEPRVVRFLTQPDPAHYPPGEEPLERLLALAHDSLARLDVVPVGHERLALISAAGEMSLLSRFKECQAGGQPGIPRRELLGYLGLAADALDQLYHLHELQHLTLAPRHLTFQRGRFILLEFGLAELLWLPEGLQPSALNPRYSAVELFDGLVSDACDQYSLALMFQEMLLGVHPLRQLSARYMASAKHRAQPDLSLLSARDQAILMTALHPDPEKRFRSCQELVLALEEATPPEAVGIPDTVGSRPAPSRLVASPSAPLPRVERRASSTSLPVPQPRVERRASSTSLPPVQAGGGGAAANPSRGQVVLPPLSALPPRPASLQAGREQNWRPVVEEIVAEASREHHILLAGTLHYQLLASGRIEHRAWARLAPGIARLKITGFREQWHAESTVCRETHFVMAVRTSGSMLQRALGRVPGLVIDVSLGSPRVDSNLTPIRVTIHPSSGGSARAEQILTELGPPLLESLRTYLAMQSERADQERFPYDDVVVVQSPSGQSVTGRLRDIGRDGLCLYSPATVPAGSVTLTLTRPGSTQTVQVPGWVRDCVAGDDGRFEVEVTLGSEERKNMP